MKFAILGGGMAGRCYMQALMFLPASLGGLGRGGEQAWCSSQRPLPQLLPGADVWPGEMANTCSALPIA